MASLTENTIYDKLLAFYQGGNEVLTPEETAILNRWDYADGIIRGFDFLTDSEREKELVRKYNISISTARNDLRAARQFFNSVSKLEKDSLVRATLFQLDKFLSLCFKCNPPDIKNAGVFLKSKIDLLAKLVGDPNHIDPKFLQQNVFNFMVNPTDFGFDKVNENDIYQLIEEIPNLDKSIKQKLLHDAGIETILPDKTSS